MARAKVFMHGGSQAVRLPKEFRFEVAEVDVRKEGDAVILEPPRTSKPTPEELTAFWSALDALNDEDLIPERDQPPFSEREFGG